MTDDTKALVERLRERAHAARDEKTATGICDALHFEEAADAIERLTRELDEARAVIAAADKGSPIYKAVERILDDQSAWIVRPNADVTKAIALAAGVAWMAAEKIDPGLDEMDRSLSEAHAALAAAQAENARLREATTATIAAIAQLQHAFGAPGDYGYNTPRGDALFALYRAQYSLDGGRADDH